MRREGTALWFSAAAVFADMGDGERAASVYRRLKTLDPALAGRLDGAAAGMGLSLKPGSRVVQ